ncbi:hypothetical protein ACA910_017969 [Epithemia clementina (nom. ined.)]
MATTTATPPPLKERPSNDQLTDRILGADHNHNNRRSNNGGGGNTVVSDAMSVTSTGSHRHHNPLLNSFKRLFPKQSKRQQQPPSSSKKWSLQRHGSSSGGDSPAADVSPATTAASTAFSPSPNNNNNNNNSTLSSPMSMSTMTTSPVKLMESLDDHPSPTTDTTASTASQSRRVKHPTINNTSTANAQQLAAAVAFEKELPAVGTDSHSTASLSEQQQQQQQQRRSKNDKTGSSSWLTRTQKFKDLCDTAFDLIDTDDSGSVDEKELYAGLLLIHLKLGMYVGPAACRPIARHRCRQVFSHYDDDQDGALTRTEFQGVMMVLFTNVLFRVLVQWSLTIILVPLVAQQVLEWIYGTLNFVYLCVVNADDYSSIANTIELTMEAVWSWTWERTPGWLVVVFAAIVDWWQAVPDSVWNAAPLALLSTLLGVVVVPYCIFQVDDFFQYLARRADTDQSGFADKNEKGDDENVSNAAAVKAKKES